MSFSGGQQKITSVTSSLLPGGCSLQISHSQETPQSSGLGERRSSILERQELLCCLNPTLFCFPASPKADPTSQFWACLPSPPRGQPFPKTTAAEVSPELLISFPPYIKLGWWRIGHSDTLRSDSQPCPLLDLGLPTLPLWADFLCCRSRINNICLSEIRWADRC